MFSRLRKLSDKLPFHEDLVGILVVLPAFAPLLALSINVRTGPQGQVTGTVQGAAFAQGEGPATKVVGVRLHNGDLITIAVSPNRVSQPGQVIVLDVHRRLLTGSLAYTMAPYAKQPLPEPAPSLQRKALQ